MISNHSEFNEVPFLLLSLFLSLTAHRFVLSPIALLNIKAVINCLLFHLKCPWSLKPLYNVRKAELTNLSFSPSKIHLFKWITMPTHGHKSLILPFAPHCHCIRFSFFNCNICSRRPKAATHWIYYIIHIITTAMWLSLIWRSVFKVFLSLCVSSPPPSSRFVFSSFRRCGFNVSTISRRG